MWRFVTKVPAGLPDPEQASTPEKAKRIRAVNKSITEESRSEETTTSRHGVKRKRTNNNLSPETWAKIAKYALENGNTRAARHFSNLLNVNMGESAVREESLHGKDLWQQIKRSEGTLSQEAG